MRPIVQTLSNNVSGITVYTPALPLDIHGCVGVGIQIDVTGTANYTIQQTYDDPYTIAAASLFWMDSPDATLVAQTVDRQGKYADAIPTAMRMGLATGSTGSARLTIVQSGSPIV